MAAKPNDPNFILLYVDEAQVSARFYTQLLGRDPIEASPHFAMFALNNGVKLCVWSRREVVPAVTERPGGCEHCFTVGSADEVHQVHDEWVSRGVRILQPPTPMDFGFTFVALDPDGHRLRVFFPSGA